MNDPLEISAEELCVYVHYGVFFVCFDPSSFSSPAHLPVLCTSWTQDQSELPLSSLLSSLPPSLPPWHTGRVGNISYPAWVPASLFPPLYTFSKNEVTMAPLPSSSSTGGETDPTSLQKSLVDAVKRGHVEKVDVHSYMLLCTSSCS